MATDGVKVNMTPSHPGDFIRAEVIDKLGFLCRFVRMSECLMAVIRSAQLSYFWKVWALIVFWNTL